MKDKYLKVVYWSEEDHCYIGICPDLMLGGVHGEDEIEVYGELCEAVGEWIQIQQEDGEPLPPATTSHELAIKLATSPSTRPDPAQTTGV